MTTESHLKEPYIIAETACNHEGDIHYLYRMIDEIAELKLNAVKFHLLFNFESYMVKKHPLFPEIPKWNYTEKQWNDIFIYVKKKGLDIIALCDDVDSMKFCIKNHAKIHALELHAVSLNDHFMLSEASDFPGPVFLGVGGSTLDEISYAINFLRHHGKKDIVLMYGFQNYPTNYADINLSKMKILKDLFKLPVGYADHTGFDDPYNTFISVAAAFMGFEILEKHYTPDPGKKRIDYHAAVGKEQMKTIKEYMKVALTVYGPGGTALNDSEKAYGNRGPMKKAIVAKTDIKKGETLTLDNLWFKRTPDESSVYQNQFLQILGCKAIVDIKKDDIIDFSKIEYKFKPLNLGSFTNV